MRQRSCLRPACPNFGQSQTRRCNTQSCEGGRSVTQQCVYLGLDECLFGALATVV